jgi:hypothetical protein
MMSPAFGLKGIEMCVNFTVALFGHHKIMGLAEAGSMVYIMALNDTNMGKASVVRRNFAYIGIFEFMFLVDPSSEPYLI